MSLSSQWSQSVVVRANRAGGEVVVQQMPNNSSARAYAASGNPIVIRARDPNVFTAAGGTVENARNRGFADGGESGGSTSRTLVAAIVGKDISGTFWVPDSGRNEMGLLEVLHRRGASNRTYVLLQSRPLPELQYNFSTCTGMNIDLSHNAFRLSKTAMALQNMDAQLGPDDDDDDDEGYQQSGEFHLGGGDSAYEEFVDEQTGEIFYQAQDGRFYPVVERDRHQHRRRSQQMRRQQQPGILSGGASGGGRISMSTKGFKSVMRASLQSLQEEDYYLVKYRDYSAWATSQYRSIAKSDTIFGRKYVEQCFALHVGREPGELIPITEAQFLFGIDILQRQLLNQLSVVPSAVPLAGGGSRGASGASRSSKDSYMQYQVDINYSALNADQFRALGALLGDGLRPVGVEYEEKKKAESDAKQRAQEFRNAQGATYEPPAWYDWSPGAVRRRVRHQLETYYVSVGRFAVQCIVIGVVGFFAYRAVKDYIPSMGGGRGIGDGDDAAGRKGKGNHRRGGGGRSGSGERRARKSYFFADEDGDDDYEYVKRGLLRSVLMGPREVMDYFLAPTDE